MYVIEARNVNNALAAGLHALSMNCDLRDSRNGPVMAFPTPVCTVYARPTERVLFSPLRNANPAFHLMESLWMLAGRNDVKFPAMFVGRMKEFSDDGETLWGAYGWRWRKFFGYDQILTVVHALRSDPTTRRAVLSMWNGSEARADEDERVRMTTYGPSDLHIATGTMGASVGKDVPCNTHIYFDMRDSRLNMTVCCRSNDMIWGAYGANAVHMSMLMEYVAASVGAAVGTMYQISNDMHVYTSLPIVADGDAMSTLARDVRRHNLYQTATSWMTPAPLIAEGESVSDFDEDLGTFFSAFDAGEHGMERCVLEQYETQFFNYVVSPMLLAWINRLDLATASDFAKVIGSRDWSIAMQGWLERAGKKS